jgi:hypothetical protein
MKLLDYELDQKLKEASDRNMIFYDENSSRDISKRLIYLMFSWTEDTLRAILIPTDAYPDFDWEKPVYGVDIVRDRRLNHDRTEALLKKHNITLSNNKDQLVLGLFGKSAVLGMV